MTNLKESLFPSKHWEKFFAKFKDINTLSLDFWKEVHLLAYLCQRFEEHYGRKFSFSFKGAPSKCPEIFLIKQMIGMLNTSEPREIKEYIDWIFDKKLIPNKTVIRSLAFFSTPGFGNEFLYEKQKKEKITKTTELPTNYKQVVDAMKLDAITYGDLAFIKMSVEQAPEDESKVPYKSLLKTLSVMGLDTKILESIS